MPGPARRAGVSKAALRMRALRERQAAERKAGGKAPPAPRRTRRTRRPLPATLPPVLAGLTAFGRARVLLPPRPAADDWLPRHVTTERAGKPAPMPCAGCGRETRGRAGKTAACSERCYCVHLARPTRGDWRIQMTNREQARHDRARDPNHRPATVFYCRACHEVLGDVWSSPCWSCGARDDGWRSPYEDAREDVA